MITERLYYGDPYCTRFTARVVERLSCDGQPAVVLDRTAFYPTGGGQPCDAGTLAGRGARPVAVVDIAERESDGAVLHLLAGPVAADEVEGCLEWEGRFDRMQQHTGQHILSAAALECSGANTVGFHLSKEMATIDLDRAPLSAGELAEMEAWANAVLTRNLPVDARFVRDEEVAALPLRKPLNHAGPVRIVQIPGIDCSACGGTHVRATGEIGIVKITRGERRGAETRVEFLCGGRALSDYAAKNALVMGLAAEYSVGHWELADAVHRMSGDLQEARRELRRAHDALMDAEAESLWREAPAAFPVPPGQQVVSTPVPARIVQSALVGRTPEDLKHLAQRIAAHPRTVALLGSTTPGAGPGHLVFARSADLEAPMGTLLRQVCERMGGRGGGRPEFAQGGGPDGSRIPEALDAAFGALAEMLSGSQP